jgi:hypothetical protein
MLWFKGLPVEVATEKFRTFILELKKIDLSFVSSFL